MKLLIVGLKFRVFLGCDNAPWLCQMLTAGGLGGGQVRLSCKPEIIPHEDLFNQEENFLLTFQHTCLGASLSK